MSSYGRRTLHDIKTHLESTKHASAACWHQIPFQAQRKSTVPPKQLRQPSTKGWAAEGQDSAATFARPPVGASTRSSSKKYEKKPAEDEDAVKRFLNNVGLSAELVEVLRRVGISGEERIKALGRLSDQALDKVEESLVEAGLGLAARVLILEGLKERANGPSLANLGSL